MLRYGSLFTATVEAAVQTDAATVAEAATQAGCIATRLSTESAVGSVDSVSTAPNESVASLAALTREMADAHPLPSTSCLGGRDDASILWRSCSSHSFRGEAATHVGSDEYEHMRQHLCESAFAISSEQVVVHQEQAAPGGTLRVHISRPGSSLANPANKGAIKPPNVISSEKANTSHTSPRDATLRPECLTRRSCDGSRSENVQTEVHVEPAEHADAAELAKQLRDVHLQLAHKADELDISAAACAQLHEQLAELQKQVADAQMHEARAMADAAELRHQVLRSRQAREEAMNLAAEQLQMRELLQSRVHVLESQLTCVSHSLYVEEIESLGAGFVDEDLFGAAFARHSSGTISSLRL